ncbi:MAG TPA: hypothetical protein VFK22_02105 [Candidatus Dormibacteraeota bacterium]|nr:hypothetical protein [Candidatus Dormibacteraeota bacterium]
MALRRARWPIVASAATYLGFLVLGIALASAGWTFAVSQRDAIVNGAHSSSITLANGRGDHLTAALLDFGSNAVLGAVPTSITGLTVIGPFPIAAYRGWVGGVVSIDSHHASRLANPSSAVYYLVTVALQLTGFILTMAAGVHVGWHAWKARRDPSVRAVLGFRVPSFALRDAAYLYAVAMPVFLAGSLYEFLA